MVFLGIGLSAFGSVLAQIYYFKPQTVSVARLFLLLISYFLGNFMAYAIPTRGWFKYLNPGPFNIKEHTAILIMCSTASVSSQASEIIAVDDLYYNNKLNPALAIFTLLASQLLGYGFAGILRDFLTWWPTVIVSANVFQALHFDKARASKRVRLFWMLFTVIAVWEIVPQYMFPVLSGFSIFCLADNGRHDFMRNLFGGASNNEGTGLLAFCLDWNYIGGDCLWIPLKTQFNQDVGLFLTYIFMMALYYGNVWKAKASHFHDILSQRAFLTRLRQNFPFMSQALFYLNGTQYDQTLILTDNAFDESKFAAQGPAYFSASNAWFLLVSNLALGSCLVHVLLWHFNEISGAFNFSYLFNATNIDDPHHNEMKKYKTVPHWWFLVLLAAAFAAAQASIACGLPWWALIVLLIMCFVLTVIYGYLASITGFQLSWFGSGFYQVGEDLFEDPFGDLLLTCLPAYGTMYGQYTMNQAMTLLSDFKLGHYTKLPPRVTFFAQVCGAVVGCILNYVMLLSTHLSLLRHAPRETVVGCILNYVMLLNIIDNNRAALLSISGTRLWSGQNPQSFNSNAISWGALGPKMFGAGGEYVMIPISLAIGIFLPIPFWLLHRKYPGKGFDWFVTPIITQYSAWLTVGINTSILFLVVIGIISQYYVRRRYPRWFTKYNYIVSGALDGGTQVMIFLLSFAVFGAAGVAHNFPLWWGNPSLDNGLSADRCKAPAN
ncbi:OPT oligopeptide transporter protein-domain-containing protein [Amylostereum chailletii]|nr:OPT oligopeptide transporter protein-domain-containing protein [Amylostereum chailletii]